MEGMKETKGRIIIPGTASGVVLASTEPLSFWGGYDQHTGEIIDRRHPLSGEMGAGSILALPFTRGSSTTTAILLESVRRGVAPAGIITDRADVFLALASVVADEMYEGAFPMVAVDRAAFETLRSGMHAAIHDDGTVTITPA